MDVLSEEIVYANTTEMPEEVEFSPLDLFAGGHLPVGPLYGFHKSIDSDRFRRTLQIALTENPELGVAIKITDDGTHTMETGHGIKLVIQRCEEPMFPCETVAGLAPDKYPLAFSPLTSLDLVDRQLPLLGFCITYFSDGGCILGIRTTHSHVDGAALTLLLLNLSAIYHGAAPKPPLPGRSAVTNLASGDGLHPSAAFPVVPGHTDTALFFAENSAVSYQTSRTTISSMALSRYMAMVKQDDDILSSSDILNALIWKAWSRTASGGDAEMGNLYGVFNIRQLIELNIPSNFLGNALLDRVATLSFGDVRNKPIPDIARSYRQQIKPLKAQEVLQDIAYLARLQREKSYGKDGTLNGFQRNLYYDLFNKTGLFINDMRFLPVDQVRFADSACWFEQGQGHAQGFVAISQHQDDIIVRYDGTGNETASFVAALQNLLTEDLHIT